jgi:peroxiredoxin
MLQKILAILLLGLVIASPCLAEALKIGEEPPDLVLPGLYSGKDFTLSSTYSRPTVLTFFASWSKSCQEQLEFLNDLAASNNVDVVAVSFDRSGKKLKEYVTENKLSNIYVLRDKKLTSISKYAILIIPTAFLIDEGGILAQMYVDFDGNIEKSLQKDLASLLKK